MSYDYDYGGLCDASQVNGLWSYGTPFSVLMVIVTFWFGSQGGGNVWLSVLFVQCEARRSRVQKVCRSFSPIQILRAYGNKLSGSQISIKVTPRQSGSPSPMED
jgi:hypothetical protein